MFCSFLDLFLADVSCGVSFTIDVKKSRGVYHLFPGGWIIGVSLEQCVHASIRCTSFINIVFVASGRL